MASASVRIAEEADGRSITGGSGCAPEDLPLDAPPTAAAIIDAVVVVRVVSLGLYGYVPSCKWKVRKEATKIAAKFAPR